jgi:hypothetical protein
MAVSTQRRKAAIYERQAWYTARCLSATDLFYRGAAGESRHPHGHTMASWWVRMKW